MDVLLIAVGSAIGFVVAYATYGRWLGSRLFELSRQRVCPSVELEDGQDYVPSSKWVVFGHHFTSIAGTGPIVGPALAVLWGWLPALLWVVFGSILIGAVHDLGALVVSLRRKGKTVGEISGELIHPRARLLFLAILAVALTIVLAVFGLVIAAVVRQYPESIAPLLIQVPLAVLVGFLIKTQRVGLLASSLSVLVVMMASVWWGDVGVLAQVNQWMSSWEIWHWTTLLLVYAYVASVLPVWVLLQSRDFINALFLVFALVLVVLGIVAASVWGGPVGGGQEAGQPLRLVAPMVQIHPQGAPPLFPFLFITVACGAVSGFHCMVSSGTSSKQLKCETDARFVAFGGMLTEGFLAVVTILACAAGVGLGVVVGGRWFVGEEAWHTLYQSWTQAGGLSAMVGAFVSGAGNFVAALGLPRDFCSALMGVMVAAFAATTMDTACRLQRYVLQELAGACEAVLPLRARGHALMHWLKNPFVATAFAVVLAGWLAAIPPQGMDWSLAHAGKGGLLLWPIFGATNQLLGGLAFLVIAFYLIRKGKPVWLLLLPMVFMLVMPAWAMVQQCFMGTDGVPSWFAAKNWPLVCLATVSLLLECWIIGEAWAAWRTAKKDVRTMN